MGHEHREYAAGGWGEHAMANIHTHTHCVPRDTEGGWNLGQGSITISTHVGVAPHQSN